MAQRAGRIVCPRCGANNFDTVSACWKCSAPIGSAAPPMMQAAPLQTQAAHSAPSSATYPTASPAYAPAAESYGYRPATALVAATGDTGVSNRAAFWLGMLMPYFGFPIGLAFMMCDDRRRQEVGRACVIWSTISGFIHVLLTFLMILGMRPYFNMLVRMLSQRAGAGGGEMGGDLGL